MPEQEFLKIKIILRAIALLRGFRNILRWLGNASFNYLLKCLIFLFWPIRFLLLKGLGLRLKVKKIKEGFPTLNYFKIASFLFLLIFFVFVISESRVEAESDFWAQGWLEATNLSKPDFVMAGLIDEQSEEQNENEKEINKEREEYFIGEDFLTKPGLGVEDDFIPTRTEIEKYIVQEGDTIGSIARDFDLNVKTIFWENKLTANSIIRPGQVLRILPVDGVSHKVKSGETVKKIALTYRAEEEEIVAFNELEEKSLLAGEVIIVPEGKIPPPPPRIFRKIGNEKIWPEKFVGEKVQGKNCRNFYPGQCTYYVAQKICISWSGHAKSWLNNARAMGYVIGKEPRVGAIISLRETWYGHVAIVEEVQGETIVISEMNHLGPWKVNRRELKKNDYRINGYIYP